MLVMRSLVSLPLVSLYPFTCNNILCTCALPILFLLVTAQCRCNDQMVGTTDFSFRTFFLINLVRNTIAYSPMLVANKKSMRRFTIVPKTLFHGVILASNFLCVLSAPHSNQPYFRDYEWAIISGGTKN